MNRQQTLALLLFLWILVGGCLLWQAINKPEYVPNPQCPPSVVRKIYDKPYVRPKQRRAQPMKRPRQYTL